MFLMIMACSGPHIRLDWSRTSRMHSRRMTIAEQGVLMSMTAVTSIHIHVAIMVHLSRPVLSLKGIIKQSKW